MFEKPKEILSNVGNAVGGFFVSGWEWTSNTVVSAGNAIATDFSNTFIGENSIVAKPEDNRGNIIAETIMFGKATANYANDNIPETIAIVENALNLGISYGSSVGQTWQDVYNEKLNDSSSIIDIIKAGTSATVMSGLKIGKDTVVNTFNFINDLSDDGNMAVALDAFDTTISEVYKLIPDTGNNTLAGGFLRAIRNIARAVGDSMVNYQDGITETSFGEYMKESWYGNNNSFLNYFKNDKTNYKIKIMKHTPLDPGSDTDSLYGSMILGCPYTFNDNDDPRKRTIINSFVKDGKFLSLTPGLPKYNGGQALQSAENDIYSQTTSGKSMMDYLLKNGIDKSFADKDKRYYTFEPKYAEYFSYLEAMLNPIWIKMGLANTNENEFNIFSFFDIGDGENIDESQAENLKAIYNSSLGFFCNATSAVTESVSNSQTSTGGTLASNVNSASDEYQNINYITGMGTGGVGRNISRKIGIGLRAGEQLGELLSSKFTTAQKFAGTTKNFFGKLALGAMGAVVDVAKISNTEDMSNWIQQFAVGNGMKVIYPELWADSSYSKSFSVNLTFTSPYGDPASIFKYVYVPFCALLCFGLPRQAAENGMVSPFFIRADIPGVTTSDLALVSDISWTKGGSANLWTKDGLPRSIDVQLTIQDLYPYLSMTKRMSFLSANPSYTVFLDNMAGLCSVYSDKTKDPLQNYWKAVINRVSGSSSIANINSYSNSTGGNSLWNKFNTKKDTVKIYESERENVTGKIDYRQIPWMHSNQ